MTHFDPDSFSEFRSLYEIQRVLTNQFTKLTILKFEFVTPPDCKAAKVAVAKIANLDVL